MPYYVLSQPGTKHLEGIISVEQNNALRSSAKNLANLEKARKGDAQAKLLLLNIAYQGVPNDDGTIKGSKRMSRHYLFDIDNKEEAERVIGIVMQNPEEWGIDLVERSVNGGAHLVGRRGWGKTILECQCELALRLHCEMDTNNKDCTRMCFSTSASEKDLVYVNPAIFQYKFDAEEWEKERLAIEARHEDVPEGAHSNDKHYRVWEHNWPSHGISVDEAIQTLGGEAQHGAAEAVADQGADVTYPSSYEGIPYESICTEYWKQYNGGKEPSMGGRNSLTYELAVNMAPLCDYNAKWMEQVIPQYGGLPADEFRAVMQSAASQQKKGMPYRTRMVLQALRKDARMQMTGGDACHPPKMPERLTKFHKVLCVCTPEVYVATVCEGAFPALGAHLKGVKFIFIDGKECEASFIDILIQEMSSGKGCIDKPIEYIMRDIVASDAISREKEAQYKRNNPSGKKKAPRPGDICIQVLMSDCTRAAFIQRLIDCNNNGGRTVYTSVDEVELLYKLMSDSRTPVATLIKLAFDRAVDGQERIGADSVTGNAPYRWNCNAKSTPSRIRQFLAKYVTDGTLSRLCCNTIDLPEDDAMPVYKPYTEKYATALQPYIERLNTAEGVIRCKQADALAAEMDKEDRALADLYDSKAYKKLARRSNVNAFKKGMVLYILNGMKWSKEIEEYVRWSHKWDMWVKFHFFGDLIEKGFREDELAVSRLPQNLLTELPEPFTDADLQSICIREGKSDWQRLRRVWKSRGHIEFDETENVWHKAGKYAGE